MTDVAPLGAHEPAVQMSAARRAEVDRTGDPQIETKALRLLVDETIGPRALRVNDRYWALHDRTAEFVKLAIRWDKAESEPRDATVAAALAAAGQTQARLKASSTRPSRSRDIGSLRKENARLLWGRAELRRAERTVNKGVQEAEESIHAFENVVARLEAAWRPFKRLMHVGPRAYLQFAVADVVTFLPRVGSVVALAWVTILEDRAIASFDQMATRLGPERHDMMVLGFFAVQLLLLEPLIKRWKTGTQWWAFSRAVALTAAVLDDIANAEGTLNAFETRLRELEADLPGFPTVAQAGEPPLQ